MLPLSKIYGALICVNAFILVAQLSFWCRRHFALGHIGVIPAGKKLQPPALAVPKHVRVPEQTLLLRCEEALHDAGLHELPAKQVAASLVAAQRDGKSAHGLGRLPAVVQSLRSGRVSTSARPALRSIAPAILRVDADKGFVQPAIALGLPALAARARELGLASLTIVDCRGIIGSLWYWLELLAEQHGLIGFACCNSPAFVAPHGGSERTFGTNPIAFGFPRQSGPSLVADFACSQVARGEMQQLARRGEELPIGVALAPDGAPTTDAALGLRGTQLPFGGHKGSLLAMMVELLGAAFTGGELAIDGGASDEAGGMRRSLLIIAIDPTRQNPDALLTAERLFAVMCAQQDVRLPGAARLAAREHGRAHGGIPVDKALWEECFGSASA